MKCCREKAQKSQTFNPLISRMNAKVKTGPEARRRIARGKRVLERHPG
jgi:hypothetical protein